MIDFREDEEREQRIKEENTWFNIQEIENDYNEFVTHHIQEFENFMVSMLLMSSKNQHRDGQPDLLSLFFKKKVAERANSKSPSRSPDKGEDSDPDKKPDDINDREEVKTQKEIVDYTGEVDIYTIHKSMSELEQRIDERNPGLFSLGFVKSVFIQLGLKNKRCI